MKVIALELQTIPSVTSATAIFMNCFPDHNNLTATVITETIGQEHV